MEVVKLPSMDDKEIKNVIENEKICRMALIEDKFPYICPFQYVYLNNSLYFHITDYGRKKAILSKNKNVCVYIEKLKPDLSDYNFVSIQGTLELVEDQSEKAKIFRKMKEDAKKVFSTNFLLAHGFEKSKGWDSFKIENQQLFKLKEVGARVGLKSTK